MRTTAWRSTSIVAILVLAGIACMLTFSSTLYGQSREPVSYRETVKKVLPAVVSVEAKTKANMAGPVKFEWRSDSFSPEELQRLIEDYWGPLNRPQTARWGLGSGFIIDSAGAVLTNHHVVDGASEVTVRLQDGRSFTATEIKSDPKTDIAVIRLRGAAALSHLEWGDSSAMEIGDRVLAVGAPFGLAGSVSAGIVSGKGRTLNNTVHEDFLQTDAAINPGNSGGPLVDLEGRVVGINTAIRSNSGGSQGVGLAISSGVARRIVEKLLKDGRVSRGYLGVQVRKLGPEVSARLGSAGTTGVVVAQVLEGSPAAKAGIQPGDIVANLDGVAVTSPKDLQQRVSDLPLKKSVATNVWRGGTALQLTVTIEEQPSDFGSSRSGP